MSDWVRTLDIKEVWQDAGDKKISLQKLSKVISEKLSKFGLKDDFELEGIIDQFQDLSEEEDLSAEDFDCVMEELYDWADISLDGKFGGKKNCWVKLL